MILSDGPAFHNVDSLEAPRMLLMLEDDHDRVDRFRATLHAIAPSMTMIVWRNAGKMIREIEPFLPAARLISLDHDLEPVDGDEDPGDGIDVARFLAARPPVCPVIVHSSNASRSDWMVGEFELGRWKYKRVAPIGDDWIEAYWGAVVRELLKVGTGVSAKEVDALAARRNNPTDPAND
jgi:hypothetical protein